MAATMLSMAAVTQLVTSPLSQVSFARVNSRGASPNVRPSTGMRIVCMSAPLKSSGPAINTGDNVASKIEDAQEICAGDNQSEECAAAWNEVEAAEQEKSKTDDPLDKFCNDNPEADECRVYND